MVLPSNGMQREALMAYPSAIALIDSAEIKPGMKILKIDGKEPDDENYPSSRSPYPLRFLVRTRSSTTMVTARGDTRKLLILQ